jgi:glycosyltransferase involved in cell wall biosynthesis
VPEIGAIRSDTRWALRELGRAGMASLRVPRHLAINSRAALAQAAALAVHGARLSYLPNVVDIDMFTPSPSPSPNINLLDVGRLEAVKRHDRFLCVVGRTIDALPDLDIRATIVGEGPDRADLEQQADSLRISDRVTFLANAPMDRVYQSASMLVLTSDNEGTPNVVLEAMAAALPVAAFSVGGVPEIITSDEVGTLIVPKDTDAMTAAVIDLCKDRARREAIGARARQYVEQSRSPEALARYLRTLYKRAAPQRSGRPRTRRNRAV